MKNFREIQMVRFCECIQPCWNGQVFADCFIPIFFRIAIHIKYKQIDKAVWIIWLYSLYIAGLRCHPAIFQFRQYPSGGCISSHSNGFSQILSL